MKHANKLWLILAVIALIGFVVIACDNGNGACTNHTWGAWQNITKQPNCIETGIGTRTCTVCGDPDPNTTIPVDLVNGHAFADNWLSTGTADWHNDEEDECKQEIETLICTRTNCNATNGTRISDPCKGTQSLVIENGIVTRVPNNLILTAVCIPDKRDGIAVTSIEDNAFYICCCYIDSAILKSVRIGANVITIGVGVFFLNLSLETVTLAPNSQLQTIGGQAFRYCNSLSSMTIPASVTSIGQLAFQDCTSLETVTVLATTPPELEYPKMSNVFMYDVGEIDFEIILGLTIFVPAESLELYKEHICGDCNIGECGWSEYASIIVAIE